MDSPDKTLHGIVSTVKSWIPWRSEPANVSKVFWMPDHSCMVCYECDAQFTIINRRHHCRLCGRVFCAKCTSNSIPATPSDPSIVQEDWERERIRVCNFCYKQWEQGPTDNVVAAAGQDPCTSPSATSVASSRSSSTVNSSNITLFSTPYSIGTSRQVQENSSPSTSVMEASLGREGELALERSKDLISVTADVLDQSKCSRDRSDDEDDEYGVYQVDSEARHSPLANGYFSQVVYDEINNDDGSHKVYPNEESIYEKCLSTSPLNDTVDSRGEGIPHPGKKGENDNVHYATTSMSPTADSEPVDFDNNGLLWLPPEPEDGEDEREASLFDDEEEEGNDLGEWGYLQASSSFGSGEYRTRDRSCEEHKKAMKTVVDGHFRALVSQLLQVENLPVGEEGDKESWLEIITSLSWEAASHLKPDMSKGGGMDPGGYVKVKCIASGHRYNSMVVKGVVCKKNVAHRRMTSKIERPRIFILGGALEYQRVSNLLSSFDTLLQQEMDHLKMAVAKIDAHQPDVLLVEKSVSRFAQDYLLAKDISLVLNIKRPLLERIARCTDAPIVPSIDHLSSQKLGYCETFHVERFLEDLGTAGQGGKKLVKTLMFFEGCPKPLGCTILLRGANGDELKKVKHVVQYGVFAAYHLGLETSFLADEGASLPELPLNSPITVALPDKPSSIERSISTVPGFSFPTSGKSQVLQPGEEPQRSNSFPPSDSSPSISSSLAHFLGDPSPQATNAISTIMGSAFLSSASPTQIVSESYGTKHPPYNRSEYRNLMTRHVLAESFPGEKGISALGNDFEVNGFEPCEAFDQYHLSKTSDNHQSSVVGNQLGSSELSSLQQNGENHQEDPESLKEDPEFLKEEFPPSPSDHQSILVSLSSRCVWKGTVCERSHLFRIKYYGSFDKPLGRFLRDHLFDQSYRCRSCEMPSEAHVHCYTHRQGTLTISVKKVQEILLPGEKEGKIWMWHRCLRCPRSNGFPPATRRVIMSDAAWGLSFGKFLELSFSNHAAASRVASCGHSLHRDCLRFYGFGKMVACFRYASIDVHSVYLPPSKLDFGCEKQEWIQKETEEVVDQAELLFSEVLNAIGQIAEKRALNSGTKILESRRQIAELEGMLQMEKAEFEASLQKAMNREVKKGQPVIDVLEINRLRRQLFFQSYMWDHRLIYAAKSDDFSLQGTDGCLTSEYEEHSRADSERDPEITLPVKLVDGLDSSDSHEDENLGTSFKYKDGLFVNTTEAEVHNQEMEMVQNGDQDLEKEDQVNPSTSISISDVPEPLQSRVNVRRTVSDGQFPIVHSLSDSLDAAWTGENQPASVLVKDNSLALSDSALASMTTTTTEQVEVDHHSEDHNRQNPAHSHSLSQEFSAKTLASMEDSVSWLGMPFLNFYRSFNKSFFASSQKIDTWGEYNPVYVSSLRVSELLGEARLLLPVGVNDTIIPVYDDEPTSVIAYALVSQDYHIQVMNELERSRDCGDVMSSLSFSDSLIHTTDDMTFESHKSFSSLEDSFSSISGSISGAGSAFFLDPLSYTKSLHVRVSFGDDGPLGKVKHSVVCYYAKRFEALRRICCPSDIDFVRSLSRCKKWGAQGGKSNVFFAKTSDDRFIIKQVTKTELESFIKFAPGYFKYLSESIASGSPTCLAKILGIYQVTKHLKGGKESKMDVLVMENLLFRRNVTRLYDLKGSARSRYNPDSTGNNKVLLDQNLIEAMPTSPIFVGNKAKRLLERAVWNDTSFLASIGVMDYSLLVGVDEEKHELVLGIIDFMRQYTWDKHLETWVKASGILGGPKNAPTVISPKQYKKRFRKAMTTYFLMVPDQWSPPSIIPSKSQSELCDDNSHSATVVE